MLGAVTVLPTVGLAAVVADPLVPFAVAGALAVSAVQLAIIALIMTRRRAPKREFGLHFQLAEIWHAVPVAAGGVALLVAFGVAAQALPEAVSNRVAEGYRWQIPSLLRLPLAVPFLLLAAYREELFFRAFLITTLRGLRAPNWAAIAISSFLFGAGHLYQGVFAAVVSAALGAYLGAWYLRAAAVHRLAIGHALFNLIVLAATLFPTGPFATFPT